MSEVQVQRIDGRLHVKVAKPFKGVLTVFPKARPLRGFAGHYDGVVVDGVAHRNGTWIPIDPEDVL